MPALRPAHVILFIALINDLQSAPDPAEPFRPLYHITNAGWLTAYDEQGRYMDAEQAYAHWIGHRGPQARVRQIAYATVTGTLLWNGLRDAGSMLRGTTRPRALAERASYTVAAIDEIRTIARQSGATFHLVLIPARGRHCGTRATTLTQEEREQLFGTADVVPLDIDDDTLFTQFPDCHLTNQGHAIVADALSRVVAARPETTPLMTRASP